MKLHRKKETKKKQTNEHKNNNGIKQHIKPLIRHCNSNVRIVKEHCVMDDHTKSSS